MIGLAAGIVIASVLFLVLLRKHDQRARRNAERRHLARVARQWQQR